MKLYACKGNFRFRDTSGWFPISEDAPKEVFKMVERLKRDFVERYFHAEQDGKVFYSAIPGKRGTSAYVVMVPFGDDTFVVSPYVLPWVEWVAPCLNIFGYAVGTGKNGWAEL